MRKFIKFMVVFNLFFFLFVITVLFINERKITKYQSFAEEKMAGVTEDTFKDFNTGHIYDSKGNLITKVSNGKGEGEYLQYKDIPKTCTQAFIAVEDRSFWDNNGYDLKGIMRVIYSFIQSGGKGTYGGASTITQQLVRLKFLTTERTVDRKLKEIVCARYLTEKFSKQEIMEFYVNNCYFANGLYGIEAASKSYFRKSSKDISLSQMAYLCAIPQRPSYFDPRVDPERPLQRRDKILRDMKSCGFITEEECQKALEEVIEIKDKKKTQLKDYQTTYAIHCAVEYLMKYDGFKFRYNFNSDKDYKKYRKSYKKAYEKANDKLHEGGFEIKTSLSLSVQKKAQEILNHAFDDKSKKDGVYKLQGAMTVVNNKTGKVIAVIGGRYQKKDSYTYNRAFQTFRQPGSSIKPLLVYTPAMEKGYRPDTHVEDIDISDAQDGRKISEMHGEGMTLRNAVEQSKNGVAYSVLNDIGVNYGLSHLKKMRFSEIVPADENLSSALGGLTYGVNTVEMASGYATIVNEGGYRNPTCILSITKDGKEIYKEDKEVKVYDSAACEHMIDVMQGVFTVGTAKEVGWDNMIPAAGKTGTTNSNKDGWFCGMTPYYSIAVWVGYDTPKELDTLKGATYPAQIWKETMEEIIATKEIKSFSNEAIEQQQSENASEEFLPGRDASEIIGKGGYTVGDYRADRTIGKDIEEIIDKMKVAESQSGLDDLKVDADQLIEDIISVKYTDEMKGKVDAAYEAQKKIINGIEQETVPSTTKKEETYDEPDDEILPPDEEDNSTEFSLPPSYN